MFEFLKNIFTFKSIPAFTKAATKTKVKQSLYATVIRACSNCGSTGVDSQGQDVGMICPVCNAIRPNNEKLGRIWWKLG